MKLLVIRHGESEADIKKVCEGRADFKLTDKGTQQARALASWINENYRVSRIYTSPLSRAKATAQFVALETKIPVTPLASDGIQQWSIGRCSLLTSGPKISGSSQCAALRSRLWTGNQAGVSTPG